MDGNNSTSNKYMTAETSCRPSNRKRIIDSMCKLYDVMQQLQSTRQDNGKHSNSSTVSPAESDRSESYSDVQYKLFDTQLKYMRKVLQQESREHSKSKQTTEQRNITGEDIEVPNNLSSHEEDNNAEDLDTIPVKLEKETQTTKSGSSADFDKPEEDSSAIFVDLSKMEQDKRNAEATSLKIPFHLARQHPKYSQVSHYHLNLSDIPFFVGTSTSASHSVIANVQSIVGLMKEHNRGLCSSAPLLTRKPPTKPKPTEAQEVKKLKLSLKKLSMELSNLTLQHEKLRDYLNSGQFGGNKDAASKELENLSRNMKSKAEQIVYVNDSVRKCRSDMKQDIPRKEIQLPAIKQKSNICKDFSAPAASNRQLMVSLRQLKKRFQNNDVVWVPFPKK